MTIARAHKIDLAATPFYHCINRCVRRTFLCGKDIVTGKDYSHRKGWIVERIKFLANVFAIKICAYAVMSNHYHVVLMVDENEAKSWNEVEIKARWAAIFPKDAKKLESLLLTQKQIETKLNTWRERLMNISWFMRCLNETIAKESNLEEDITGRFWEGRFKSQALLDEGALLSAMTYVDLNPVRANIATTPEESDFTSIQERIQILAKELKKTNLATRMNILPPKKLEKLCDQSKQPSQLVPFANGKLSVNIPHIDFKLFDYLQLVDYTGRILREDKKSAIPEKLSPLFSRLNLNTHAWVDLVKNLNSHFSHAIGNVAYLKQFSPESKKRVEGDKYGKILLLRKYGLNVNASKLLQFISLKNY